MIKERPPLTKEPPPSKIYVTQPNMKTLSSAEEDRRHRAIQEGHMANTSIDYAYMDAYAQSSPVQKTTPPPQTLSLLESALISWFPSMSRFVDMRRQVSHASRAADEALEDLAEKEQRLNELLIREREEYKKALMRKEVLEREIKRQLHQKLTSHREFSEAQYRISLFDLQMATSKTLKTFAAADKAVKELKLVEAARHLIRQCASDSTQVSDVMYKFNVRMKGLRLGSVQQSRTAAMENIMDDAQETGDEARELENDLLRVGETPSYEEEDSLQSQLQHLEESLMREMAPRLRQDLVDSLPDIRPRKRGDSPPPPPLSDTDLNMLVTEGDI